MDKIVVVANLENQEYKRVMELRKELEAKFGITINPTYVPPHITFQGGNTENVDKINIDLKELSKGMNKIPLIVNGAGRFENQVIFLEPEKNKVLIEYNKKINKILDNYCESTWDYYRPEYWNPHVSILADGVKGDFEEVYQYVQQKNISFKQNISSIQLIKKNNEKKIYDIVGEYCLKKFMEFER